MDLPYVQECLKLYGSSLLGLSPATNESKFLFLFFFLFSLLLSNARAFDGG